MSVEERKRQDFLRREDLMVDVAQGILLEKGYAGLTMEGLASAASYSKGTVYQHFKNKEEVLLKIACQAAERRVELFRLAAAFPGRPRERFVAIMAADRVFHARNPQQAGAEQIVQSAFTGRLEEGADKPLQVLEAHCMEAVTQIVEAGVAAGDLAPDMAEHSAILSFGAWALAVGARTLHEGRFSLERLGVHDPEVAHETVLSFLLDGVDWRPLSSEHDYRETLVAAEQFMLERLGGIAGR